jgi:hypothetical protein
MEFFDLVKPDKEDNPIKPVEKEEIEKVGKIPENFMKPTEMKMPSWLDRLMPADKEQICSKKPSFIDLSNDGDEEPAADPPSKLNVFINRFLKHAKRAPSTVNPV